MTLTQEYFKLTNQFTSQYGEKTLLLMQVGAFFEVYGQKRDDVITGSQILEFSRICDLNIADKKTEQNLVMAGFSVYMIDKYLKKIQEAGYTIVVYRQDEQMKNTTRSLDCIYSPGTYFSQESIHITNNTTCIWLNVVDISSSSTTFKQFIKPNQTKIIHVGISNIDILNGTTNMFEYTETYINSPTTFDELERFVSIYKPSEVIFLYENLSLSEIEDIIQYAGIQCNTHKIDILDERSVHSQMCKNCEKQTFQIEILNRYYSSIDFSFYFEHIYSTQSFCYLLDFIYQHNPILLHKISEPTFENCTDRLTLANHSLKQLNIIQDQYNGKYSSVEKLLNVCITPMGKRQFSYLLLNPTTKIDYLQEEYDITFYLLNKTTITRNKLSNIKDISKILRQIIMKKVSPKILFTLYKNLINIQEISTLQDDTINEYLRNKNIDSNIENYCDEIKRFFEKTLDIQKCSEIDSFCQFDENFILKGVNEFLDEKVKVLLESQDKLFAIQNYLNQKIQKFEKKQNDFVKIHETEKMSIQLVATRRRCTILKQELSKENKNIQKTNEIDSFYQVEVPLQEGEVIIQYTSSFTGQQESFVFSYKDIVFEKQSDQNDSIKCPLLTEICKNITQTKGQMKEIITNVYIQSILEPLSELFSQKLESIISFITYIDVIYTKAYIADKYHYCKPEIDVTSEKSYIQSTGMRHPLIEHIHSTEIYVTNDIQLGKENQDGILLYGTNAVGKTSFIRAIGISVIMAQAGLFVPCSSFVYKPYEYIFTRILGNDNIFKGLSTFAVEMSELRTILKLSNCNSLILGDELCSGTESISAKSIFVAGVQSLIQKKSSFIFATHLHEIIDYDEIKNSSSLSLKHMAVIYDREKDKLIYNRKLENGPGNNMYGLEVCRSLSLPKEFIDLADQIRIKYNSPSILSLKESKYNSKKIRNMCEKCGEQLSTEIHHLIPQKMADERGYIRKEDGTIFHKNHLANLMAVCESCHQKIHHK
jgi:DNA mismatch repair protein MutS